MAPKTRTVRPGLTTRIRFGLGQSGCYHLLHYRARQAPHLTNSALSRAKSFKIGGWRTKSCKWRRECPPINERNAHFIGIDSTHLLATYTRTYTTRARHPMATGTNVELLALSGKRGEAWHRRTAARSPICCWVEGQSVKMNLGSLEPRQAVKVAPCNCHGVPILPRTGQTSVLYVEL